MADHVTAAGAAYGTAKAGIGISGVGTFRPDLIMKVRSWIVCVMSYSSVDSVDFTVPDSRRHVRYHRGLRPRHRSFDRRSFTTLKEHEFVQVRLSDDGARD